MTKTDIQGRFLNLFLYKMQYKFRVIFLWDTKK
jgi:hypothetical protein